MSSYYKKEVQIMINNEDIIHCGIDVSKKNLDAFVGNKVKRYDNTIKGVKQLIKDVGNVHYIFESTGGYERLAAWYLLDNSHIVSVVNPKRVRDHARSKGLLAKTDSIDARVITSYADQNELRLTQKPSPEQLKLTALVGRRHQLSEIIKQENNRLELTFDKCCIKSIRKIVRTLEKEQEKVEADILTIIKESYEFSEKAKVIQSICGLGYTCAITLLAYFPEIGTVSRREAAALAGLAPYNKDSGNFKGIRKIFGGRSKLRAALYMGAMSAKTYNPILREVYNRLVDENHRPGKVALVAVMRKLVIAANSAVKNSDFMLAN